MAAASGSSFDTVDWATGRKEACQKLPPAIPLHDQA